MFGLSIGHIIVLLVVVLIFGPKRLPTLSHNIGKAVRNLKDALEGIKEPEFRRVDPNSPEHTSIKTAKNSQEPSPDSQDPEKL